MTRGQAGTTAKALLLLLLGASAGCVYGPPTPRALGVWPDPDTTAVVQLALWNDARLDGGTASALPQPAPYLAARAPQGPLAGAYRSWLQPEGCPGSNEPEPVAGSHILQALARTGLADLAGFRETEAMIRDAVARPLERALVTVSPWYPQGIVLHADVARAWADGPVSGLGFSAQRLAGEVERAARVAADGTVTWEGPDPAHATALALTTLLLTGRGGPLVEGGLRGLLAFQDPRTGGWPAATVCTGHVDSGAVLRWRSAAVPTALALEVLALHRLGGAAPP